MSVPVKGTKADGVDCFTIFIEKYDSTNLNCIFSASEGIAANAALSGVAKVSVTLNFAVS